MVCSTVCLTSIMTHRRAQSGSVCDGPPKETLEELRVLCKVGAMMQRVANVLTVAQAQNGLSVGSGRSA